MNAEIRDDIVHRLQGIATKREELYSQYATRNSEYLRRKEDERKEDPVIRPPFSRDADRIIHSKAYSRYIDKTQVFFLVDNDHVTHRVLHVQLVSKVARTIGRALGLNEDLIEAISLGHDIGHPPFGHFGEKVLDEICKKKGIGKFLHNVESIQFLDVIENCNLTLQVLDGILCHNGESHSKSLAPDGTRDWDSFQTKIEDIKSGKDRFPLTYEGCVVRIADTIAYLGRDLQDALEVKIISDLSGFPRNCAELFGISNFRKEDFKNINRSVLDRLIRDIINNSYGKDKVSFSDAISKCVKDFYEFNTNTIYENSKFSGERQKIRQMFQRLFDQFLQDLNGRNKKSWIYPDMTKLDWIPAEYFQRSTNSEIVRDYIAGMTDRYFENALKEITIPDRVKRYYQ